MAKTTEVRVPDIGDFKDVPIIEVAVAPGDVVGVDDPLITLESDKATMDVPAPAAGTVQELLVKVGDRVSEGSPVLTLAAGAAAAPAPPPSLIDQQEPEPAPRPAPAAAPPPPPPATTGDGAAGAAPAPGHAAAEAAPAPDGGRVHASPGGRRPGWWL